jgi:hypothetical protein
MMATDDLGLEPVKMTNKENIASTISLTERAVIQLSKEVRNFSL